MESIEYIDVRGDLVIAQNVNALLKALPGKLSEKLKLARKLIWAPEQHLAGFVRSYHMLPEEAEAHRKYLNIIMNSPKKIKFLG
ncbi:MAG: hypothetical protein HOL16_08385 [Alphaproteobacteria bacterium]|jgi:hypothetical protein|nr:hypothetical protein [Alphaproteobacteria bacterium]